LIRAALALALAAAGCGHSFGPCEGTCVDVTVTYDGPAAVRQLAIAGRAPDGFSSQLALPAQPADPIDFPAYFTLRLDPPHAPLDLTVVGLDGAREVAAGAAEAIPAAGARTAVTIALGTPQPMTRATPRPTPPPPTPPPATPRPTPPPTLDRATPRPPTPGRSRSCASAASPARRPASSTSPSTARSPRRG
jgi:hypothetical protein